MKDLKEEIVDNNEILNIVNEIKLLVKENKSKNVSIKDLMKDYPKEIEKLEEALLIYIGENDLKILKAGFSDKWKNLTKKLAYPYEYFNSIDDYQKPVDNLKREHFFSKLKSDYPDDDKKERTKESIKKFNIKNGED